MAEIRTIGHEEALDVVWEELVYTEARLLSDPLAKSLAPQAARLLAQWDRVAAGQRAAWRAEIVAQAAVDQADDELDEGVDEVARELLHEEKGDRGTERFKGYFRQAPNEVTRLGLESELEVVRSWPEALQGEAEKTLQRLSKTMKDLLAQGDAAVEGRQKAAVARATQRVREVVRFVDDVVAARRSMLTELHLRAQREGKDADWALRFFKRGHRGGKRAKTQPAATTAPTPATKA